MKDTVRLDVVVTANKYLARESSPRQPNRLLVQFGDLFVENSVPD